MVHALATSLERRNARGRGRGSFAGWGKHSQARSSGRIERTKKEVLDDKVGIQFMCWLAPGAHISRCAHALCTGDNN